MPELPLVSPCRDTNSHHQFYLYSNLAPVFPPAACLSGVKRDSEAFLGWSGKASIGSFICVCPVFATTYTLIHQTRGGGHKEALMHNVILLQTYRQTCTQNTVLFHDFSMIGIKTIGVSACIEFT